MQPMGSPADAIVVAVQELTWALQGKSNVIVNANMVIQSMVSNRPVRESVDKGKNVIIRVISSNIVLVFPIS